jgi:hypothetical protein
MNKVQNFEINKPMTGESNLNINAGWLPISDMVKKNI